MLARTNGACFLGVLLAFSRNPGNLPESSGHLEYQLNSGPRQSTSFRSSETEMNRNESWKFILHFSREVWGKIETPINHTASIGRPVRFLLRSPLASTA